MLPDTCFRLAGKRHIDFVREKRHMGVRGAWGVGTLVFSQLHVHQLLYVFIRCLLLHCYIHTNYHITIMCMHINHFHVNQQTQIIC